ncbi:MAG: hypothetical protein AAGK23_09145 [Pseudomonadota bacterium]
MSYYERLERLYGHAINEADVARLGWRARELLYNLQGNSSDPSAVFADACSAPAWLTWTGHRRDRLIRMAGAASFANALSLCIDGQRLRQIARWVGVRELDALLASPPETGFSITNLESENSLDIAGQWVLTTASPSGFSTAIDAPGPSDQIRTAEILERALSLVTAPHRKAGVQ